MLCTRPWLASHRASFHLRSAASLTGDLPLLCPRSFAACQSQGQVSQAMSIGYRVFESLGLYEKNRPFRTCFFRMHQRRFEHPTHGLGNPRKTCIFQYLHKVVPPDVPPAACILGVQRLFIGGLAAVFFLTDTHSNTHIKRSHDCVIQAFSV